MVFLVARGVGMGQDVIQLGQTAGLESPGVQVFYDGAELQSSAGKPWLRLYLLERYGFDIEEQLPEPPRPFGIEADRLSRHAIVCGSSGSGKTRLSLHILREQLRLGYSAVVLDIKGET